MDVSLAWRQRPKNVEAWLSLGALILACASALLSVISTRVRTSVAATGDQRLSTPSTVATTICGRRTWVPPAPDAVLFFTLAGCQHCERLLGKLASMTLSHPYLVVQQGQAADLQSQGARLGLAADSLVPDPEGELLDHFGIDRVPHALRIQQGAVVRSISVEELSQFVPSLVD